MLFIQGPWGLELCARHLNEITFHHPFLSQIADFIYVDINSVNFLSQRKKLKVNKISVQQNHKLR